MSLKGDKDLLRFCEKGLDKGGYGKREGGIFAIWRSTEAMVINRHAVTILRWTGGCPSCRAKRPIIKKLGENQAYCEKCGLGFANEFLEEYTTNAQEKEVMISEKIG